MMVMPNHLRWSVSVLRERRPEVWVLAQDLVALSLVLAVHPL